MRKKILFFLILVYLVFLFSLAAVPNEKKLSEIDTKITMVYDNLLGDNPPGSNCQEGFKALMEAIVLMLPQVKYSEKVNNQIITAANLFKKTSLFNPDAMQLLKDAYRSINEGKDFHMPEISSIQEAVEYARKWVKMSQENLKLGKTDQAVKRLLDIAIMVITPVKKES
jgi:hypothetical protein